MPKRNPFGVCAGNWMTTAAASACAALLLCMAASSTAQEERPRRPLVVTEGLQALRNARVERLPVDANARRTARNFRFVVTVEGAGGTTKVLDTMFNEKGEVVEGTTRDAHLAAIFRKRAPGGGLGLDSVGCKDKCYKHLESGNAPKYAVCWYSCMIFDASGNLHPH